MPAWNFYAVEKWLEVVDPTQAGFQFAAIAFGLIVLSSLSRHMRARAVVFSGLVGVAWMYLYRALPGGWSSGSEWGNSALGFAAAAGFSAALVFWFMIPARFGGGERVGQLLRSVVSPSCWPTGERLTPRDLVLRWYVTIAAGTGATAGMLIVQGEFWTAFKAPDLLALGILTIMVFMLIGPGDEYLLEKARTHRDAGPDIENPRVDALTELLEHTSARAWGRLVAILIFSFVILGFHGGIDAAIRSAKLETVQRILGPGLDSSVFAFYWSAALQTHARSVSQRAGRAIFTASLIFYFPLWINSYFITPDLVLPPGAALWSTSMQLLYLLLMLLLVPLVLFVYYAVPAMVGGYILDQARKRLVGTFLAVSYLSIFLGFWASLLGTANFGLAARLSGMTMLSWDSSKLYLAEPFAAALFTGIALYVSGFPQIFERWRASTAHLTSDGRDGPEMEFDPFRPLRYIFVAVLILILGSICVYFLSLRS